MKVRDVTSDMIGSRIIIKSSYWDALREDVIPNKLICKIVKIKEDDVLRRLVVEFGFNRSYFHTCGGSIDVPNGYLLADSDIIELVRENKIGW